MQLTQLKINYLICAFIYLIYLLFNFKIFLLIFGLIVFTLPFLDIGKEIDKSHGIEGKNKSRLGGFLILLAMIFSYYFINSFNFEDFVIENFNFYLIVFLAISLLGFVDDILGRLGHLTRLYFNIFAVFILLYTNEAFLFNETNFQLINLLLEFKFVTYLLTIFIIVGFINACNISDGANGILSGISLIIFLLFYFETGNLIYFTIFEIILFFFIYNMLIGKVYLGDMGSYLLGFLISTNSLYLYSTGVLSAGILACILFYPSIEVLMAIIRRSIHFKNPFLPDNNHLHNLIYKKIFTKKFFILNPNSTTGTIILLIFTFPGLILYFILSNDYLYAYWILFILQIVSYLTIYKYLKIN
tara:strand:+ start:1102 stop:2175 length:1074 start_codon:yes stop_codon:yes gene_type:complete